MTLFNTFELDGLVMDTAFQLMVPIITVLGVLALSIIIAMHLPLLKRNVRYENKQAKSLNRASFRGVLPLDTLYAYLKLQPKRETIFEPRTAVASANAEFVGTDSVSYNGHSVSYPVYRQRPGS